MPKYIVTSPVKTEDGFHQEGEIIELDEQTADEFIALGALAAEEAADSIAPTDPAARQDAILAAIDQIDQEDAAYWMKDGRPNTAALAQVLGWTVAAKERDTAYAAWKAQQEA